MSEPSSVDPELQDLTDRIAAVRASIAALKDERARTEQSQSPAPGPDPAVAAMKEQVAAARARLVDAGLEEAPDTKASSRLLESSLRKVLYFAGAAIAVPGAVTLALFVQSSLVLYPGEKLDETLFVIVASPLLLGLALLGLGRFAKYRADESELDDDFV